MIASWVDSKLNIVLCTCECCNIKKIKKSSKNLLTKTKHQKISTKITADTTGLYKHDYVAMFYESKRYRSVKLIN